MELTVLLWILGGGFSGTWGLCIFFMIQSNSTSNEIRREISELHNCVKDHHARLSVIEDKNKKNKEKYD